MNKSSPARLTSTTAPTAILTASMRFPQEFGKYKLLEFVKAGGMAEVFRAETDIGKVVALKIMKPELAADPDPKSRFLDEAKIAAQFDHPNIVAVFHHGEEAGRPYMEMEYLQGSSLDELICEAGKLTSAREQLQIAVQAADALACVHAHGIKHRDVKPANVYVCDSGVVKLIDFGIAKGAQSLVQTATGFAVGTPFYMAPEQILGDAITERTDIYAFGVALYETATKTRAVTGDNILQISHRVLKQPLDMAPARSKGVPEAVIALIERCTAKPPGDRPSSFVEVRDELRRILRDLDQAASGATPLPAAAAPRGSLRRAVGLIAAGLALLTAVALFAVRQMRQSGAPAAEAAKLQRAPLPQVLASPAGEMRLVAGGPFLFGKTGQRMELPDFYIDRYEVSNAAYREFASATGREPKPGAARHPVVQVNLEEARSFCQWAKKRLPTAMEWEKAARGPDGLPYPWGRAADARMANAGGSDATGTKPAGSYPQGASPYGVEDLLGNVWEFVDTPHIPGAAEIKGLGGTAGEPWVKAYGGAFNGDLSETWDAAGVPARHSELNLGFRCAADPR